MRRSLLSLGALALLTACGPAATSLETGSSASSASAVTDSSPAKASGSSGSSGSSGKTDASGTSGVATGKTDASGASGVTSGATDADCSTQQELDRSHLLRRLSFDLRNKPPTYEEYLALDSQSDAPDAWIDTWLESDDYRLAMRRFHESLLWPNPAGAQLLDTNTRLVTRKMQIDGSSQSVYAVLSPNRRQTWRGNQNVICGDWLQEDFNSDGSPIPRKIYDTADPTKLLYVQEGYVRIHPYWSPSSTLLVCAFDAQTALQGSSVACDTRDGLRDAKCGCGPGLEFCYGPDVQSTVWADLREQVNRAVDDVTVGGAPYTDLITSKKLYMNGHLAFWKKYLAQLGNFNNTYNGQGPGDPTLPAAPDYLDSSWTAYERSDVHSGILTMAAYTLRFQSNRGRANHFRIAFTGQYFVPSSTQEDPATTGCSTTSGDLTQRCDCRGCHQDLEPLAAHFAKVLDAGSTLLSQTPTYRNDCDPGNYGPGHMYPTKDAPPASCARLYETNLEGLNPGWLLTHQFAYISDPKHDNTGLDDELHRAIYDHIVNGPPELGNQIIDSGQFANATVRNLFKYLMSRDMNLDASRPDNELSLLTDLSSSFQQDYSFSRLVKRLVQLPQYRRVR